MIVIYHQNNNVVKVESDEKHIVFSQKNIANTLFEMAVSYRNELILWCHIDLKSNFNFSVITDVFHHNKIIASYNPFQNSFLSEAIGYIEESPFIKINKKVSYPTWQMSSCVGGVHSSVLLALKNEVSEIKNFDYFLHSMAKLAMQQGLLCYSEPLLLKNLSYSIKKNKNDNFTLFRFVKEHYKTRWVILLFLNFFLYERKVTIFPLLFSFFYSQKKLINNLLNEIQVQSVKKVVESGSIDVIIPTIGRKEYLYDVLKDLSQQTHLPKKVIIVEQNPNQDSISELDYLTDEIWNFKIKHIFTHQAGACNARNLALGEIENEWLFFADDDIRFGNSFLEKALNQIELYGVNASTYSCLQKNEKLVFNNVHQWSTFGSGCSIIKKNAAENIFFKMEFEFGFGEDAEFGMQLRNLGTDVVYFPVPEILHLKAPIGGFRTKPVLLWQKDFIQPKPSPTVMLFKMLNLSHQQIKGYKTILFFKFYKVQTIKNPILYFINFRKQWKQSLYWANELNNKK
ncbi:MAG: glycosyltransferase family A protein [Flavobacterium sp.]